MARKTDPFHLQDVS